MTRHAYSDAERAAVYRAINEARDMRHFLPDPVDPRHLPVYQKPPITHRASALCSPGVSCASRIARWREQLHAIVEQERRATANALNEREDEFMRLKVEGVLDCGELLVVVLMDKRERYIFGRRTLPEMDLASVSCAIQNLWLAARAEGLGVGWVSLFSGRVKNLTENAC